MQRMGQRTKGRARRGRSARRGKGTEGGRARPVLLAVALLSGTLSATPSLAQAPGRIWGEVVVVSGERHTGYVRWDRNEAGWWDVLDGRRRPDPELHDRVSRALGEEPVDRERSVEFLGVRITWEEEVEAMAETAIRFGHLAEMRTLGDDGAILLLRDGSEVELRSTSSDLGTGLRELVVEVPGERTRELRWRDLERIRFRPVPLDAPDPGSARLHGTVEDRWGGRWTGDLSWDRDEVLSSDILDGEEEGEEREIPFELVAAVERRLEGGARVTLRNGRELVLTGTNDVDRGHRGVQVSDRELGRVEIPWDAFASVHFHPPGDSPGYDDIRTPGPLRGTVVAEDGSRHRGRIVWDGDERAGWQHLDGEFRGLAFAVEFGGIRSIEKASSRAARVELRDGRILELAESNDVDRTNRGIAVEEEDGSFEVIQWREFRRLELDVAEGEAGPLPGGPPPRGRPTGEYP